MNTLILTPALDDRDGAGVVASRIGVEAEATVFAQTDDLYECVAESHAAAQLHCVLVDEAQFLAKEQVYQLTDVCDRLNIPVLAYGLRTDFKGEPFNGSQYLLAWADKLKEVKAICHCGSKATMVVRTDESGLAITSGSQIEIGGNDRYISLCRRHFKAAIAGDRGAVTGAEI